MNYKKNDCMTIQKKITLSKIKNVIKQGYKITKVYKDKYNFNFEYFFK